MTMLTCSPMHGFSTPNVMDISGPLLRSKCWISTSLWMAKAHGAVGSLTSNAPTGWCARARSEEHTSELQSLMRISYAVFCLKKKKKDYSRHTYDQASKIKLSQ